MRASSARTPPVLLRPLCLLVCLLGLAACGGQSGAATPAARRHAARAHHAPQPRRSSATAPRLIYRPLYSLPAPVQDPAVAPVGGRDYALLGGLTAADTSTAEVLLGGIRSASVRGSLPNAQHDAQAATLGDRVYVFGGGQFSQYDHILAFDPLAGTVAGAGRLPAPASDVAVTGDGTTAWVIGGFDGTNWLDTILAYRPGSPVTVAGRLPVALRYAAAAYADGYVLIAGGSTQSGVSDTVYRFDPASGHVIRLLRLRAPVTHAAAAALGRFVYLIGGRGASVTDRSDAIWAIDPRTGRIVPAGRLPQPLSDAAAVALGNHLLLAGGATSAGTQAAVGELVPSG